MNFTKIVTCLILLGFSCNVMSMKDPDKTKKKESKDETFLSLLLIDSAQVKQSIELKNKAKGPLSLATENAFDAIMYGQSPDLAMAQIEKVQKTCVDFMMHPYRRQFEVIARVVCKDYGIQDGTWAMLREGSRAPQGSTHAIMFRKFILLNDAMQEVLSEKTILSAQELTEILDMYENKKPIDIHRLETILQRCKK